MGNEESVSLTVEGAVAWLAFNAPGRLNTLTLDTIRRLDDLLREVASNPHVRCLVVRGEGRAFMAGGDLGYLDEAGEQAPGEARKVIMALNAAIELLSDLPMPTVASVHGAVAGAGNSIMLACDLAIAASDTRFVYAYDAIASTPDGGLSWLLPRVVGQRRALEIAFLSEPLTAQRAFDLGLVNRLVDPAALEAETAALAGMLAGKATRALVATRRLMRQGQERTWRDQLGQECLAFCESAQTRDFLDGVRAFFEKRPAQFVGK